MNNKTTFEVIDVLRCRRHEYLISTGKYEDIYGAVFVDEKIVEKLKFCPIKVQLRLFLGATLE